MWHLMTMIWPQDGRRPLHHWQGVQQAWWHQQVVYQSEFRTSGQVSSHSPSPEWGRFGKTIGVAFANFTYFLSVSGLLCTEKNLLILICVVCLLSNIDVNGAFCTHHPRHHFAVGQFDACLLANQACTHGLTRGRHFESDT